MNKSADIEVVKQGRQWVLVRAGAVLSSHKTQREALAARYALRLQFGIIQ